MFFHSLVTLMFIIWVEVEVLVVLVKLLARLPAVQQALLEVLAHKRKSQEEPRAAAAA